MTGVGEGDTCSPAGQDQLTLRTGAPPSLAPLHTVLLKGHVVRTEMPQQQRVNLMLRHCQRSPLTLGATVGGGLAQAKVSSREARELGRCSVVTQKTPYKAWHGYVCLGSQCRGARDWIFGACWSASLMESEISRITEEPCFKKGEWLRKTPNVDL